MASTSRNRGENSEPPRIYQVEEEADSESRPRATPREEKKEKGGYECEFVESPPKQLQSECSICLLVLREPHLVSCCGQSFCKTCIEHIQRDGKPCPLCTEPDFSTMANKGLKRTLNEFQVRCPHRELGCEWVGELGKFDQHLNVELQPERQLEGCPFTSVECIHCKDHMRRQVIAGHQNECPKRPYTCEYCEECVLAFEDAVDHWAECKCYLLPCPNNCNPSGSGIERQNLDHHVKEECPLTVVECDFHYAGCGLKLPRKDMAGHMKEESVAHTSLLAAENQKLSNKIDQQERTIRELKDTLAPHGLQMKEGLRQTSQPILPIKIKMTGFKRHKDENTAWYSPPFYTHMCGYKLCLRVDANGFGDSEGTHVSVFTHFMRGEFDSDLNWPFRGDITIQILNQLEDKEHHAKTIPYTNETEDKYAGRVTAGEDTEGWGKQHFIPHSHLKFDRAYNCQYLKFDCLIFRVQPVEMYLTQ